ncbi:hypothetical protein [Atlantibacter subterraneus]|uniref:hypothetical protein n=1 Tax=Atlantibacter subterraneus TaxID=255519 RepID=UPI002FDCC628
MKNNLNCPRTQTVNLQKTFQFFCWFFLCVFAITGIASCFVWHYGHIILDGAFQGALTVEQEQTKSLWNVAIYILPLTLAGLSLGCLVIALVNGLVANGCSFFSPYNAGKHQDVKYDAHP